MKLDFFSGECREPARRDNLFGICDDQNGRKAYTDIADDTKWIATVKNNDKTEVTFTAIDKCVIKDNEYEGRGRCDGMLTTVDHLYLVELKDIPKGWKTDSIKQVESTIELFKANHDITPYRHKKAFVCNKKHKHFHEIDNEFNLQFYRKHKFRIDIQAEIVII